MSVIETMVSENKIILLLYRNICGYRIFRDSLNYIYTYIFININVYKYMQKYTYMSIYRCVCVYVFVCACLCIFVRITLLHRLGSVCIDCIFYGYENIMYSCSVKGLIAK